MRDKGQRQGLLGGGVWAEFGRREGRSACGC